MKTVHLSSTINNDALHKTEEIRTFASLFEILTKSHGMDKGGFSRQTDKQKPLQAVLIAI